MRHRLILIVVFLCCTAAGPLQQKPRPVAAILDVAWSPDGQHIAHVDSWGAVEVRRADGGIVFTLPPSLGEEMNQSKLAWNQTGTQLAVGIGNHIMIWNTQHWSLARWLQVRSQNLARPPLSVRGGFTAIDWIVSGDALITVSGNGITTFWDLATRPTQWVNFSGGGMGEMVWLRQNVTDGTVVINPYTMSIVQDIRLNTDEGSPGYGSTPSITTEVSHDSARIAYAVIGGRVIVVSSQDLSQLSYIIINRTVTDIAWSDDDEVLAVADVTGQISTWRTADGQAIGRVDVGQIVYAVDIYGVHLVYGGRGDNHRPTTAIIPIPGLPQAATAHVNANDGA